MKLPFALSQKPERRLGLDIGAHSIKLAEVQEKGGALTLLNCCIKELTDPKDAAQAIGEALREKGITAKKAALAVSGEHVVSRYISMPKMNEAELKKAMTFELEDHIPFKTDEVYTDYHVFGEDPNAKNRIRVLLVATKKEPLEERLALVRQAGLIPQIITTDAMALKTIFYHAYPQKRQAHIAILNVGERITNLLIAHEEIPYFVRDTRFGGETLTTLIQTKAQLDRPKAELLKCSLKETTGEMADLIKASLSNLLNEIFVSLDFYENLTEQRIDELYLTGGSSQLVGLKEFLGGYLNVKILQLDPFLHLTPATKLPAAGLTSLTPYLAVALGLALEQP